MKRNHRWFAAVAIAGLFGSASGAPASGQTTGQATGQAMGQAMGTADHPHGKAAASTSLSLTVHGKTTILRAAELQGMPQKTVTVHNAHRDADETYAGVSLTDLLAKAGAGPAEEGKALLHSYLKVEGTDGYWVLYSGIEIEAASHAGDVLVATTLNGRALGENGEFMMVSTEDRKPQRWVRNLAGITLVAVP